MSGRLLLGGALLAGPFLLTLIGSDARVAGGMLGGAWWVFPVVAIAGVLVLIAAFTGAFRLFRRVRGAMGDGYGWVTVALVAADRTRDTGFLLQGARAFSALSPDTRRALLVSRLLTAGAVFAGSLWLPLAFGLAVVLAGAGFLGGGGGVVWLIVVPVVGALFVAALPALWGRTVVRWARKRWHKGPRSAEVEAAEARSWTTGLEEGRREGTIGPGSSTPRWVPSVGAVATLLVGVLVVVPTVALVGVVSVSSVVSMFAVPQYGSALERRGGVEPLQRFRVTPDESITAEEAGDILHLLTSVGPGRELRHLERSAARTYEEPWFANEAEGRGNPTGLVPAAWPSLLFERVVEGMGAEGLAYLEAVAAHPAQAEFQRLARAPALDAAAAWHVRPLPDGTSLLNLPVPRFSQLRLAAYARMAPAALLLHEGRVDEAELPIREVISVGFLLSDEGVTLIDNLMGAVLAGIGGTALESLLSEAGRGDEAEALARERASHERAVRYAARRTRRTTATADDLREMSAIVTDTTALRGLRWELFTVVNTTAPCMTLSRVVFGPGDAYHEWVDEARASLVRRPSEEERFELARLGFFGRVGAAHDSHWAARLLGRVMAGPDVRGSCGEMIRSMTADGRGVRGMF